MSNIEKAKESSLGPTRTTTTPRDHKNSTVHVKDNELAWSADRTDDDLKGETIKKYPDDFGLEGLLRLDFPS